MEGLSNDEETQSAISKFGTSVMNLRPAMMNSFSFVKCMRFALPTSAAIVELCKEHVKAEGYKGNNTGIKSVSWTRRSHISTSDQLRLVMEVIFDKKMK